MKNFVPIIVLLGLIVFAATRLELISPADEHQDAPQQIDEGSDGVIHVTDDEPHPFGNIEETIGASIRSYRTADVDAIPGHMDVVSEQNPMDTVWETVDVTDGRTVLVMKNDQGGETPEKSTVTVFQDGLPDDSVRAVLKAFHFKKADGNEWELESVDEAFRCYRGEHIDSFSGRLCP